MRRGSRASSQAKQAVSQQSGETGGGRGGRPVDFGSAAVLSSTVCTPVV